MKISLFAAALLLTVPMAAASIAAHAKPPTTPHYDCSKAGNKVKAACKTQAMSSASSSAASSSSKLASASTPKTKTFDCSKAGNKNKSQCKTTAVATATQPAPMQMPMIPKSPAVAPKTPVATPVMSVAKTAVTTAPAGAPGGATAQCKDGTYSLSKHHSGSCSHHGGVAQWLS